MVKLPEVVVQLKRSGYTLRPNSPVGWYRVAAEGLAIMPGSHSELDQGAVRAEFSEERIVRLVSLKGDKAIGEYYLEPELVVNVSARGREKRQLVNFDELPLALIHAVLSIEDKRFFQHLGFDSARIAQAAYQNWRQQRKGQGASTLTMQLARNLWLEPEKTWRRKLEELLISIRLEHKLSKKQIFEYYCNQIYLGQNNTFNIHGFGAASRVYLGKNLAEVTVPEAALLAGLIQRPSYYNPFEHPDRARKRRDVVLSLMHKNGYITAEDYTVGVAGPVTLGPPEKYDAEAPYFMALTNDELNRKVLDKQGSDAGFRVYATLDRNLQSAAEEAVKIGIAGVDRQLRRRHLPGNNPSSLAQVALIALDPHTGEIKALVGGRDYATSQLNHAIAKRQPGSVFKPFVYAAALRAGEDREGRPITPETTVLDQPTTFWFDGKPYQPGNFHDRYHGEVTLRRALASSMNIPAVKVAEMTGYEEVVSLAREVGLGDTIQPTPALALGAYETSPLEIAGAYTLFANEGVYVPPTFLSRVQNSHGEITYEHQPEVRPVLAPDIAYETLGMLQEVVEHGTASGLKRSVKAQIAAKTGTSRDGWFAGFTPNLLCVVWVGFDDHRELGLEGAKSAMPIWAEFMKRALRQRHLAGEFRSPTSLKKRRSILTHERSSPVAIRPVSYVK